MRLFVGTLHSGENEFDECVGSIRRQRYTNFQHEIFSDLPNKEAHAALFKAFLARANEFDALVKVDADMILASDLVFGHLVKRLEDNSQADVVAIAVHDCLSDQLIWGLNAYRNTVRWDLERNTLFVDVPELPQARMLYDDSVLAPAAFHCQNPSPLQAFHYGVHRGLKAIHPDCGSLLWVSLERIRKQFRSRTDVGTRLAVLGAEMAYAGRFGPADLDYTNPRMREILERFDSWSIGQFEREITRLRWLNWGCLPGKVRRRMLISRGATG